MKVRRHKTKALVWIAAAVLLIAAPLILDNIYWTSLLILVAINILLTSSIRIIWLTGQITIGHAGFMLIGAYTSALLVMKAGFSFWLTLSMGGLAAAVVALTLGFPFMRVRGIYFTILSVVTAESFRHLAYNWWTVTGGRTGLLGIPSPGMLSVPFVGEINFQGVNEYYYMTLAVVSLSLLILYLLEMSRYGFTWKAICETSDLAGTVGVNVLWFKVMNFVISSFFAGLAGSLFAHFQHTLSAGASGSFGVMTTIYLLVYMVVGGEGRFVGAIIGVSTLTLISEFARPLQAYQPMLVGGIAMLVVILMPEGLVGLPGRIRLWAGKRTNKKLMSAGNQTGLTNEDIG